MTEAEVQLAIVEHLRERGWDVTTENVDYTDVIANRGAECIVAEVKGHTSSPGLDVDTMFGQLLRRMTPDGESDTRYAVVVPASLRKAVERVPPRIRGLLAIDVWTVDNDGTVTTSATRFPGKGQN